MRKVIFCLMAMMGVLTLSAQTSIYDFKVKDDAGKDVSLTEYNGKVLLIVNTATRCGFTPQYKELEALYEKYANAGFEILDFPCNQFGEQAPGTIQEIHQFCTVNFDIQFPQFDKIDVNGANEHPLYTYLKAQKGFGGFDTNDQRGKFMDDMMRKRDADYDKKTDIKWNFTKFLVSRDGRVLKRYEPTDKMSDIEAAIQQEVNPVLSNIMTRTSIRQYTNEPVSKADIETMLRAGMAAPTAVNRQPWHFVAVTDKAKLAELAGRRGMIKQAGVAIVVCGNMDKAMQGPAQAFWIQDCSAATENILLAAHALGLGAVWTGCYPMDDRVAEVSKALKLPETIVPLCVIAIGHPAEQPAPKDKWKPENVSYNEFGGKAE
jgi:glutathione peroxidase-family protein